MSIIIINLIQKVITTFYKENNCHFVNFDVPVDHRVKDEK